MRFGVVLPIQDVQEPLDARRQEWERLNDAG
jgi:hypothetical protein